MINNGKSYHNKDDIGKYSQTVLHYADEIEKNVQNEQYLERYFVGLLIV